MTPQQTIGHYRIVAKLGEGGMGEVWRATDTRLNRDVAIKVLPPALANDAQYMARFEREAQTLASLNHSHIAALYGIEQDALIMELVEGPTLADRIAQGPVPIDEAISIARQIADGLEAAHERGIVHRDLKPANIKITPAGHVKLLDFGLAKSAADFVTSANGASPTISPTLSLAMTQAGMILGTAAYMAPEQARGRPVDKRADIWAFGVVLYEMLTGRQLFGGDTVTDTLASVVKDAPDLNALPASTPPQVRRLLDLCLRKDPSKRLRDIGDARIALDEPAVEAQPLQPAPRRAAWTPWAVAALAILAAGAGWWRATRPAEPRPLIRMNVELAALPIAVANTGSTMAMSRDGRRIALVLHDSDGKRRVYTRRIDQERLTPLAGTEDASTPFFSPDGQWIGFWAVGSLKKVSVEGGAAVTLCAAANVRGVSWAEDGNLVFAPATDSGLVRVPASGGAVQSVTTLAKGERTHRWPEVLPGGQAVVFTAHSGSTNYDDASIDVISLKTGQRKTLRRGGHTPRFLRLPNGSGRLLYMHKGTLFATAFDPENLEVHPEFAPVLEGIQNNASGGAAYAVSATGTLVYLPGPATSGQYRIFWADASGTKQAIHEPFGAYFTLRFSPDGKRLAYTVASGQSFDLWVKDLERGTTSRLSFLDGANNWPVWTPDGQWIVFRHASPNNPGLYCVRSDGAGEAIRLTDLLEDHAPYSFSPDGKRLATTARGGNGSVDVFTAAWNGDPARPTLARPEPFLTSKAHEGEAAFSPDGRWLAYVSTESGTPEIYVRPYPGPGGRWQITAGGGTFPAWSRTAPELFYRGGDGKLTAVPYTTQGPSFNAGKPRRLSEWMLPVLGYLSAWDLAPDGKRWAVILPAYEEKPTATAQVTFLLNFADHLQRK